MSEVKIKVGFDYDQAGADRIKAVPREIQESWEKMRRSGVMGSSQAELFRRASETIGQVGQQGKEQGFFSRNQRQEIDKAIRTAREGMRAYYQAQIEEAKRGGSNLERELTEIAQRLTKAEGATRTRLQRELVEKQKEWEGWKARGGKADTSGIEAERDRAMNELAEAHAASQLVPTVNEPGQQRQQGRRWFGGFGGQFMRGLVGGATVGGGYLIASKLRQEFHEELQRGMIAADLSQRLRPEGMGYDEFRRMSAGIHKSFSPAESTEFLSTYGTLVGGPNAIAQSQQAAGLTRAFGFSPGEGASIFGQASRVGIDQSRFAQSVGQEVVRAQLQGREGEVFHSLLQMSERLIEYLGRTPDVEEMSSLIGRLSMSGLPGLQGQYGAQATMRFDDAVRGTSLFNMPDMRQLALLSTFSRMGVSNPVDMMRTREQGVLGNPEFGRNLLQTINQFGGSKSFLGANMIQQFGLSLGTYDKFQEAFLSTSKSGALSQLRGLVGAEKLSAMPADKLMDVLKLAERAKSKGMNATEATAELEKIRGEARPEAKAREELADLHRLEADAVRKMIPAYSSLLEKVNDTAGALADWNGVIEKQLQEMGLSKQTAGAVSPFVIGGGVLAGMSLLRRGAGWALGRGAAAGTGAGAAVASESAATGTAWTAAGALGGILGAMPFIFSGDYDPNERKRRLEKRGAMLGALSGGAISYSSDRESMRDIVSRAAVAEGLPPETLLALVKNESDFRPGIEGPQTRHGRAVGLGQILQGPKGPFPQYSTEQLKDPETNASLSARYFRQMLDRYDGSLHLATQAYNAGPGAVDKYGGVVPYKETQEYTARYFENLSREVRGSATIYVDVRDKKTGEKMGQAEVPLQPTNSPAAAMR